MNKEYFSHDYDPISDDKMLAMVSEWGAVGYGLYWHIVEKLHKSQDNTITFSGYIIVAIAKQMKVDAKQITAFVDDCVNVFELFKRENEKVFCERVFRNIGKRKEITEARKAAGSKGGAAKAKQNVAIAKQKVTNRKENIKVKEKEKDIIGETIVSPDYKKFYDWLVVDAPRLLKMKEPFTENQYLKILLEFSKEEIYDTVLAMQNYEGLTKKVSANLTFRKWATNNRERNNKNIPTDNPNQLYQNGYPVDKNNPMTFI